VVQREAWLIAKMSHGSMLLIFQYTIQLIHDIIESTSRRSPPFTVFQCLWIVWFRFSHGCWSSWSSTPHQDLSYCQRILIKKSLHNLPEHQSVRDLKDKYFLGTFVWQVMHALYRLSNGNCYCTVHIEMSCEFFFLKIWSARHCRNWYRIIQNDPHRRH